MLPLTSGYALPLKRSPKFLSCLLSHTLFLCPLTPSLTLPSLLTQLTQLSTPLILCHDCLFGPASHATKRGRSLLVPTLPSSVKRFPITIWAGTPDLAGLTQPSPCVQLWAIGMAMERVPAIGSPGRSRFSCKKGQLNKCLTFLSRFPFIHSTTAYKGSWKLQTVERWQYSACTCDSWETAGICIELWISRAVQKVEKAKLAQGLSLICRSFDQMWCLGCNRQAHWCSCQDFSASITPSFCQLLQRC